MNEFSVLMSVYFKEKSEYLKIAIDSILNQTLLPNELVIIKDGKLSLELEEVLSSYNNDIIKIYELEENVGLGRALAFGVTKCNYDIICRMDSDDYADKNRFSVQIPYFVNNNLDMLGANTIEFLDNEKVSARIMPETHEEIIQYAKKRNPFIHPSMVLRKSKILEAGNYRDYYLVEDFDMWVRMLEIGAISHNIQQNLVYMRVSKDFYDRRGGLKYYKSIRKFFKELKKKKWISNKEYYKTMIPRMIVYLAPSFIRKKIYEKKLRG